jgi:chromate transporter
MSSRVKSIQPTCFNMATITARDWFEAFKLGCLSFGGPAGQIALMHRQMVSETGQFSERQFADALSFCMLLPGPEALQLAIFLGWQRQGWRGGVLAGIGFLLPGVVMMLALASVFVQYQTLAPVIAILTGLKILAVVLVLDALMRLATKALSTLTYQLIALAALFALAFSVIPYPVVIGLALLVGLLNPVTLHEPVATVSTSTAWRAVWVSVAVGVLLWLGVSALLYAQSGNSLLWRIHVLFSEVALAGFGGAYAVVAWIREVLPATGASLGEADWATGLALTETTPGPLVLVLPFYGFLALFRASGDWLVALGGGGLLTFSMFMPSFVLVIALGRFVEQARTNAVLLGGLRAVTAAVFGVITVFALHLVQSVGDIHLAQRPNVMICVGIVLGLVVYRWLKWPLPVMVVMAIVVPLLLQLSALSVFHFGQ